MCLLQGGPHLRSRARCLRGASERALQDVRADPRTRAIPVIAVTASVMTQDRQKIMAAGFDGYQAKPIEVTQFVAAVRNTVGRPAAGDPP